MTIRVIVADDHLLMLEGLCELLKQEDSIEIVGRAANGRETVRLARELQPDVVIMDVSMPDLNGIDATRRIVSENPGLRVLALSMHRHEQFVNEMFAAGALGYLLKDCSHKELIEGVRAVHQGRCFLGPGVADMVVGSLVHRLKQESAGPVPALSPREREVLQLLAEGRNSKEIAFELGVGVKTVDTHRRNVMLKLDIHSVAELTKYAVRAGITSLE